MLQDIRFALRMLAKHRWFSAAVIATLAVGIGINSTVFALVNAVLFKPVPVHGGDRIVTVNHQRIDEPEARRGISWPDFLAIRDETRSFEALEAFEGDQGVLSETGIPPERYEMGRVSAGLFEMIRQPVALGRSFTPADGAAGAPPVVILSHRIWQQRYGGSLDVLDRAIRVNGTPATIIGVMPEGFHFPNRESLWMPLQPTPAREDRTNRSLLLFGLLRPGVSVDAANADLDVIGNRLATAFPESNQNLSPDARTFHDTYNGGPIKVIFLLMLGAVGFVLLIACANVANMMLARSITRGREIAVRAALGASRFQLIRQLLIESVLLASIGGLLGFAFSGLGLHLFDTATTDVGRPYWIQFEVDWTTTAYLAALCIGSGVIFGLVPALRASRVYLATAAKEGSPGAGRSRSLFAATLVVLQFALTVVLLAGAGAMIRSLFASQALNAFVQPESLFTARLQLPDHEGDAYHEADARRAFFDRLLPELRTLPGVTGVAAANRFPGMGAGERGLEFEGRPLADPKQPPQGGLIVASPGYLAAIDLPLLTGRDFDERDGETGREAALVSRAFADRYWPEQDPIGQRFRFHNPEAAADAEPEPWITVVGITANMTQNPAEANPAPFFILPYRQQPWAWVGIVLRTRGDAAALATPVRSVVQRLDAELPVYEAGTLALDLERQRWFLKVFGSVFSIFAASGLLMAAVGIYGVIAHQTARRTREIGIRLALGATARHIARLVLTRGITQLAIGLVIGLAGAFAATQVLANIGVLIGISSRDPLLFGGIVAVLLAVGLTACWLPARRATKVAPTEALRTE